MQYTYLLKEDGDKMLQETGCKIILDTLVIIKRVWKKGVVLMTTKNKTILTTEKNKTILKTNDNKTIL